MAGSGRRAAVGIQGRGLGAGGHPSNARAELWDQRSASAHSTQGEERIAVNVLLQFRDCCTEQNCVRIADLCSMVHTSDLCTKYDMRSSRALFPFCCQTLLCELATVLL